MMQRMISVFGGAHIDRRARISGATALGASNPGTWFEEAGGGGFNAARTLSRLGHTVQMISARGGDGGGDLVARAAQEAGVIDRPLTFLDRKTPSYTAILENDGNLVVALADMELYRLFTARRLQQRGLREVIASSALVVSDANLPAETIARLCKSAAGRQTPVAGIAISPAKVGRYAACLPALTFLFMNRAEARALTGGDVDHAAQWAERLSAIGLSGGIVTGGGGMAIAFQGGRIVGITPPALDSLGDVTGAGDALAAGFLSAFLGGSDLGACLRQGIATAGITVRSPLAVSEKMSQAALAQAMDLVPPAEILS